MAAKNRKQRKVVVTTNGCFDILHAGHVSNLEAAKKLGDVLMVGINSDASVRQLKGPRRPIMPARDRALVLAGLWAVDYVFIFSGKGPIPWIKKVRPSVHVKGRGSEHSSAFAAEKGAVEAGGGRVALAPLIKGRSTTDVIDRILSRHTK